MVHVAASVQRPLITVQVHEQPIQKAESELDLSFVGDLVLLSEGDFRAKHWVSPLRDNHDELD
jgi:hypothetical protein